MELARAVRRQHDRRLVRLGADRPDLRDRDLEVREHLEQERLELLVGTVDLVDQQHDLLRRLDRLEQRPPDEELRPEQLLLGHRAFLRRADVEQLPGVVPLVDGVRDVEALVALEPDQPRAEAARQRLRRLGLPHARLALEQQRLLEREREVERGREAAVREVARVPEAAFELVDRTERHLSTVREQERTPAWGHLRSRGGPTGRRSCSSGRSRRASCRGCAERRPARRRCSSRRGCRRR